jgi:CubicO group peptidase (beta-lactamase class C family)
MKNEILQAFDAWLAEHADFSGVLYAADEGGEIASAARGGNRVNTSFAIASGTKLFTAIAVCKLAETGKFSLDAQIGGLLSFDLGEINPRITVRQLLTHTSGVGDYVDEEDENFDEKMAAMYAAHPPAEWVNMDYYRQFITPLPAKFAPGLRFCYSNSGYVLLGLIVEAASGRGFQDFVADEIITPLGLAGTGFYRTDALPPHAAAGYENGKPNTDAIPVIGGADGGIFSCAADIDTLWRALFANRLLSPAMTDILLTPHVIAEEDSEDDTTDSTCPGLFHFRKKTHTFYYSIGADAGVGYLSGYYPRTRTVVSMFSNTGFPGAGLIFGELPELLG